MAAEHRDTLKRWINAGNRLPPRNGYYFCNVDGVKKVLKFLKNKKTSLFYSKPNSVLWLEEIDNKVRNSKYVPIVSKDLDTILKKYLIDTNSLILKYKTFYDLIDSVCISYGIDKSLVLSKGKSDELSTLRQFICYYGRILFEDKYMLREYGKMMGDRDHTSIIYAIRIARNRLDVKDLFMMDILEKFTLYTKNKFQ